MRCEYSGKWKCIVPELLVPDVLGNIIFVGMLHGKRGSYLMKSNKGWQVHLYGEAARCVPYISNPRVVEGEPGRCT